jgi:uncharacterized protein with LGFP repeats
MTLTKTLAAAAAALLLSAGVSIAADAAASTATVKPVAAAAQSATVKPAKMAKMHKPRVQTAVRSEQSKACSAQADAKSLHGQPRREFRKSCLKAAAAALPAAKAQFVASGKPAAPAATSTH